MKKILTACTCIWLTACGHQITHSSRMGAVDSESTTQSWVDEDVLTYCVSNVAHRFQLELMSNGEWQARFKLQNIERHTERPSWSNTLTAVFYDDKKKPLVGAELVLYASTIGPTAKSEISEDGQWPFAMENFALLQGASVKVRHECQKMDEVAEG